MVTILPRDTLARSTVSNSLAAISVVLGSTASAATATGPPHRQAPAAVVRYYAELHATSFSTTAAMQHPLGYMSAACSAANISASSCRAVGDAASTANLTAAAVVAVAPPTAKYKQNYVKELKV